MHRGSRGGVSRPTPGRLGAVDATPSWARPVPAPRPQDWRELPAPSTPARRLRHRRRQRQRRLLAGAGAAVICVALLVVAAQSHWFGTASSHHAGSTHQAAVREPVGQHIARGPRSTSGAPAPAPARSFTIVATGDFLTHMPLVRAAETDGEGGSKYNFEPMLAKIKPIVRNADLALCHVETPITPDDSKVSGYPVFDSPHELADAIADTGYDGCSTASNHSIDEGQQGVDDTLAQLDRVGVGHVGTASNAQQALQPDLHHVDGITVAHLSYTYGLNGYTPTSPWEVNLTDLSRILADAHRAKAAGANMVVVSMHWGTEYHTAPTAEQQQLAHALLASPDVDLILGDHVHVVQPVERIGNKFVIYGMGNLLSNQSPEAGLLPSTEDGAVFTAHVRVIGHFAVIQRVTYTPTFCERKSYTAVPVAQALDDPSTPQDLRKTLQASWLRTTSAIGSIPGHLHDATPDQVPSATR